MPRPVGSWRSPVSNDDRPKRTFAERDRMRREGGRGDENRPRGKAAEERERRAAAAHLEAAKGAFASGRGGAEGARLAGDVRKAHGTPELAGACRAYLDAVGMPDEAGLLSLFLDSGDTELVVAALRALLELHRGGSLDVSGGLRSQIRVLEQDFNDDIAEAAEDLLAEL